MSNPLKKINIQLYNNDAYYNRSTVRKAHKIQNKPVEFYPLKNKVKIKAKKKKKNIFAVIFALCLLSLYGYYVCPYNFEHYLRPLYLNRILNRNLELNTKKYITPTLEYLYNSTIFNTNIMSTPATKAKSMAEIKIISEMTDTKNKILELQKHYSKLEPAVFVWEYSSGAGFEINSDKVYPAASLIKIPMVFELMRTIERSKKTQNPIELTDRRMFTEAFRTSGSGNLQKTRANILYSIDYLANIMIAESDNSATNMILYEIGGINSFNREMRNHGLKITHMDNWLPDIEGENKTTAREISKILYNIDNPNYIDVKYKNVLKEYLGNTKNTHLLKEKLPSDVMVLHKTGNIASMIGDSGIIYTSDGKKYIVTIMVKRPSNDFGAKTFIQEASLIIYNDIKSIK